MMGRIWTRLAVAAATVMAVAIVMAGTVASGRAEPPNPAAVASGEVQALVDRGVTVVDVRTPREWRQSGVIPGSRLITAFDEAGRLQPGFSAALRQAVAQDQEVVVVCASGRRSAAVSDLMASEGGYTRVYDAADGIQGWLRSGRPLQSCPNC